MVEDDLQDYWCDQLGLELWGFDFVCYDEQYYQGEGEWWEELSEGCFVYGFYCFDFGDGQYVECYEWSECCSDGFYFWCGDLECEDFEVVVDVCCFGCGELQEWCCGYCFDLEFVVCLFGQEVEDFGICIEQEQCYDDVCSDQDCCEQYLYMCLECDYGGEYECFGLDFDLCFDCEQGGCDDWLGGQLEFVDYCQWYGDCIDVVECDWFQEKQCIVLELGGGVVCMGWCVVYQDFECYCIEDEDECYLFYQIGV